MTRAIALVLVSMMCVFLFAPQRALTQFAASCTCTAQIRSDLCDADAEETFAFGSSIVLRDVISSALTSSGASIGCSGVVAALPLIPGEIGPVNLDQQTLIDESVCESVSVPPQEITEYVGFGASVSVLCFVDSGTTEDTGSGGTAGGTQAKQTAKSKVVTLENPIPSIASIENIPVFIGTVVSRILVVVGALTLLVFIYGGVEWLQSGGSEEKVRAGTQAMLFAVLGLVIIFASYGILNIVISRLQGR